MNITAQAYTDDSSATAKLQMEDWVETENSDTFKLKLVTNGENANKIKISYLNVSLYSDTKNKKICGKVTRVGSSYSTNLTVELQSKNTGRSWYTQAIAKNVKLDKTISVKSNTTKFWQVKVTGIFNGNNINSYYTYSFLYNKKCVRYPNYKEAYTNKSVKVPPTNYTVNQVKRDPSFRNKYISWFKKNYPNANVNFSSYEIHHMRPLQYGGSNSISNGIALKKSQHDAYTLWWKGY